jgi:lantibiotic modifying enzyme
VTSSLLEALDRLAEHRDEICDALLAGRRFQTVDDVALSTGDAHNRGRSVTIFTTDAGKLVYKPHDLRVDEQLYKFVERFFGDFVGVPHAIAFGSQFGVCEFVEKRRAEGEREAERFWYHMGGLAAFAKLLGSTDLHFQNILCCQTMPYIIDLETMLSPISADRLAFLQSADTRECHTHSLAPSLLMPSRVEDMELSVLTNTEEGGIAPVVDGKIVTVRPYLPAFKQGYSVIYARIVEQKQAIREAISSFPSDMTVRIVLRATRGYWLMLQKLYHHSALASPANRQRSLETLDRILRESDVTVEAPIIDSEVAQMRQGDVPYFYTYVDSLSLYGGGEELVQGKFSLSAIERIVDTLDAMGKEDEAFDLSYIERAIGMYSCESDESQKEYPVRRDVADTPISREYAIETAKRVFQRIHDLGIRTPNGRLVWGYVASHTQAFQFSDAGLFDGFTGLAVFASACAAVWPGDLIRRRTDALVQEAVDEIQGLCHVLDRHMGKPNVSIPVGEGSGFGGILTGIALMRRYAPSKTLDALCEQVLAFLGRTDFSGCTLADRIGGLSGLVAALCRFEEYRGHTTMIRNAADRILELKTFAYKDHVLWKTMFDIPRALSGAGHGMSGIAEALVAAADVLDDDRYLRAAAEALDYEIDAYRRYEEKFGTWADLREFPPVKYMHGYCAGAPGTGIVVNRMLEEGRGGARARTIARMVRRSVDGLPLMPFDHLCCGNSAIVEYYLSVGDHEAAGRVLGTITGYGLGEGKRQDLLSSTSASSVATLFNGVGGIGYELLRYAYPDTILSVL